MTRDASQEPTRASADNVVLPPQAIPVTYHNTEPAVREPEPTKEATLDSQILEVMGKRILEERVLDEDIPTEMAIRWEEILKKGLPTEDSTEIIKKYPPPKNAKYIDPPAINPEVMAVLPETVIKRDERIAAKQVKLAACIAAVGKMFLGVLNGSQERLALLERLSDTGRLLADFLHEESVVRRSLVLANIGSSFKEILNASTADDFLFGRQLDGKVKAAKVLESTSRELGVMRTDSSAKGPKNSKFPPRRVSGSYRQRSTGLGGKKTTLFVKNRKLRRFSEAEESPPPKTSETEIELPPSTQALVLPNVSILAGRLRFFLKEWKRHTTDNRILAWIAGYEISFSSRPIQQFLPKDKATVGKEAAVIKVLVKSLLEKEAIESCQDSRDQFLSDVFTVPKSEGRLSFDFKCEATEQIRFYVTF